MTDTRHLTAQLDIRIKPDTPEAGAEMEIKVAPADERLADPGGATVTLRDDAGHVLASRPLERDPESDKTRALLRVAAPGTPGTSSWSVCVSDADGTLAETAVPFEVVGPVIRPSVWNLPPAITAGTTVRFSVGLASTPCWSAANRTFLVEDADGRLLHSGVTGPDAGALTGVHSADVELTAPAEAGRHLWRVRLAKTGDAALLRSEAIVVPLNVVRPPDRVIRLRAYDADSGQPVERARVVAHPFRTVTGPDGCAEIAVPSGTYRVFVSGQQYFPFRSDADMRTAVSVEILAAMHVDRPFDEVDQWS
jgi:hypothetical protein